MPVLIVVVLFVLPLLISICVHLLFWKTSTASRLKLRRDEIVAIKWQFRPNLTIDRMYRSKRDFCSAVTLYDFMYEWYTDIYRGFFKWNMLSLMLMTLLTLGVALNVASADNNGNVAFREALNALFRSFANCLLPLGALLPTILSAMEWTLATVKCDKLLQSCDGLGQ